MESFSRFSCRFVSHLFRAFCRDEPGQAICPHDNQVGYHWWDGDSRYLFDYGFASGGEPSDVGGAGAELGEAGENCATGGVDCAVGGDCGADAREGWRWSRWRPSGNRDLGVVGRFVKILRRDRPGLVCSILVHANAAAAAARVFLPGECVWVQSIHTLQERPRWHWYVQGVLSSRADAIIAPSGAVIRKLGAYGPVPCATVSPNGIDVARFAGAEAIPVGERPWPVGAWVVGYVGRFDRVKRLPLLMRGARELMRRDSELPGERLHLALVGYGPMEGSCGEWWGSWD